MVRKRHIALVLLSIYLVLFTAGCKKEPPAPPPPPPPKPEAPPPPPASPTVSLTAEPSSIDRGKSATLRWSSSNANSASLDQGIGAVPANGSREVFPTQTTRYTVTVTGPGGNASASAEVAVRVPPPPPPPAATTKVDWREVLSRSLSDAYFDYDKSDIRADGEATLRSNADALKRIFSEHADARVVIEGHCDERGTSEYNLALGDRRASSARDFVLNLGVPAGRLSTISYGKERPQCSDAEESCWQRNRRAHFSAAQ